MFRDFRLSAETEVYFRINMIMIPIVQFVSIIAYYFKFDILHILIMANISVHFMVFSDLP